MNSDAEWELTQLRVSLTIALAKHEYQRANEISAQIRDIEQREQRKEYQTSILVNELWPGARVTK